MMWFGWKELNIDKEGFPTEYETGWRASCFILFAYVVYVGKIKGEEE
jgi:hypothetical protein